MGGFFSQPWRELPENNQDNLNFMKRYQPQNDEVNYLRILLHGPVGAGKSSFVNSVDSVLQGKVSNRASTDATFGKSFTRRYTAYKIRKDRENFYPFIFNDIMGYEQKTNNGVHVEDVILALMGQVKEGYRFDPEHPMEEGNRYYNSSPTLDDRVHVLVTVIPVDSVSVLSEGVVKKLRDVRLAASDMGIPQLAILTKPDEACSEIKNNVTEAYSNDYLKEQVEKFSLLLGLQKNYIFLVKNYESELSVKDSIDKLILVALRQMINFGEDFLNNQ